MRRLVARGLMLVAALMAVCAFHSSSEPVDQPTAAIAATVDLVGPLHLDLTEVPSTSPSADEHAHLAVAWLLGLSLSLVLLGLVTRARRTVAVRPHLARIVPAFDPPPPATPSLVQLRISRT
ncbi:hypothetical protein [Kribbella italica]|uniref:Uncharacterized protein n=1 Tax=Kribbella italica TaxID=1540520 RepID=A0A7W9J4W6_9ACTN|nr:hypothetical protein [Kribbella italica]MBB5835583.1 hypothetical protein [Kribbella italica]